LENLTLAGVRNVRGLIFALMCFTAVTGCSSLAQVPGIPERKADLYSVSMMGADLARGGTLKVTTCSSRYMDVDYIWPDGTPTEKLSVRAAWPANFGTNQGEVVVPLSAQLRKTEAGVRQKIRLRGYVLFANMSTCRIRKAVFVPSDDPSIIEPDIMVLTTEASVHRDPWAPRAILFTGFRILLNESLTIAGPIPFKEESGEPRFPVVLSNGVPQENRDLRGVNPPDLNGTLSMDLWFHGKPFTIHAKGNGDNGLFIVKNRHTVGMGVLLPEVRPPQTRPEPNYRFALGGGLLVDGPVGIEGTVHFSPQDGTFTLSGRMNQAGSILSSFRAFGEYRMGPESLFQVPGEIDVPFEFNHRPITLVWLPDPDRKTYWIGSIDQNLFGVADPSPGRTRSP
jgi:hypothetical protein